MEKILVPTDFSNIAVNAMHYAIAIAKVSHKELVLFYASEDGKYLNRLTEETVGISLSEPGLSITSLTLHKPFNPETVNETVSSNHIGLIVMGTAGEGAGLSKKLLGTNTIQVLNHVNCPVIAVPPGCLFSGIKKIGYASDLSDIDIEISKVISFARMFDASIELFHISPIFPDLGDVEKMDMDLKLRNIKEKHQYHKINYSKQQMDNDNKINEGIEQFLKQMTPDLLVMFHNKRGSFDQLFSASYTGTVISGLNLPLLVFSKR